VTIGFGVLALLDFVLALVRLRLVRTATSLHHGQAR
jgi:hypothetical protein